MLIEAIKYLTTPCPPHLRAMGYLSELIATEARLRRCRAAWSPHLEKSKSVIAAAIDGTAGRRKAVVLGGGMLSDIPLGALSDGFETVQLIDVCFLNATRKAARRRRNVVLKTADITGVAAAVHAGELPQPAMPYGIALGDADLVISANVISQLPLVPLAYLRKRHDLTDTGAVHEFSGALVRAHLDLLQACPGTVCLITEVERQFLDGGIVLGTEDPLWGVKPDMKGGEEWQWDIAPRPEASPDYDIRNRVRGVIW